MLDMLLMQMTANPHMWVTFGLILVALVLYAMESIPLELTSIGILSALMVFFQLYPLTNEAGEVIFSSERLLLGFSNPALIAVLALLVLGQAIIRTGSLNQVANIILRLCKDHAILAIGLTLVTVAFISQFLNNTPTCVIFMPIMAAIAKRLNLSASKVMIPLSYASIVGGITTLIGSSTNLLVSGTMVELGRDPLGFFDFLVPGAIIAVAALTYIIFILPRIMPDRAPLASELAGGENRQFVVQLDVADDSPLVGRSPSEENLFEIKGIALKMIHRGEHAYLPPFDEGLKIRPHDILVVASPRSAVSEMFSESGKHMFKKVHEMEARDAAEKGSTIMAEIVIAPASRMIGQTIEQVGFYHNYHSIVLGVQRRSRMITTRMTEIRLAAGDVLLVMGSTEDVLNLRDSMDVLLMEWSTEELPSPVYARRVNLIFGAVVAAAALEFLPIHISALVGVLAVIVSGCINLRQAIRALNAQIVLLVAAGLALSAALQATGGAGYLAEHLILAMEGYSPIVVMSAMFMMMAVFTNILSNNATAVLFTPIALNVAAMLNVDPMMFIFAVIFASNCCSFATPIGYQTNLLVMAPGHYKFTDYMKGGIPLIFIVLATYIGYCYWVFV